MIRENCACGEFSKEIRRSALRETGKTAEDIRDESEHEAQDRRSKLHVRYLDAKKKNVVGSVKRRFELANQKHTFDAVYSQLSRRSHGRIASLVDDIEHPDGIEWPPRQPGTVSVPSIDYMIGMTLEISGLLFKRIKRKNNPKVRRLFEKRMACLKKWN